MIGEESIHGGNEKMLLQQELRKGQDKEDDLHDMVDVDSHYPSIAVDVITSHLSNSCAPGLPSPGLQRYGRLTVQRAGNPTYAYL